MRKIKLNNALYTYDATREGNKFTFDGQKWFNQGECAQIQFIYHFTGKLTGRDNISHKIAGDYNGIQIKSYHATVAYGTNIEKYLKQDAAIEYAYVTKDLQNAYIMSRYEYTEFLKAFTEKPCKSSEAHGNRIEIRLKREPAIMLKWLEVNSD